MFICSNVSLRFSVSSLIFHLNDISIAESRVFKSPTIIVLVSTSPFRSVFAWYIQVLLHCVCVFLIATSSWWIDPFISLYIGLAKKFVWDFCNILWNVVTLSLITIFRLNSVLFDISIAILGCLLFSICKEYNFPFLHIQSMCVKMEVYLL